jgi:hypothetical protein
LTSIKPLSHIIVFEQYLTTLSDVSVAEITALATIPHQRVLVARLRLLLASVFDRCMVTHSCAPRPSRIADRYYYFNKGWLNDLYRFSPTSNAWTALTVASPPSARWAMGFESTPDGMPCVFGGVGDGSGAGAGAAGLDQYLMR